MPTEQKLDQIMELMNGVVTALGTLVEEAQQDGKAARGALKALLEANVESDVKLRAAEVLLRGTEKTIDQISDGMATFVKLTNALEG